MNVASTPLLDDVARAIARLVELLSEEMYPSVLDTQSGGRSREKQP
jgi:hypothetical protein